MKRVRRKSAEAFTLIELLIVVAIIALLASIALPNLLEAQMRSKVARLHSDMRTTAVALEAYAVDQNRYPNYKNPTDYMEDTDEVETFVPVLLTTPVAYLTKLPIDVFPDSEADDKGRPPHSLYYKHNFREKYWGVMNEEDEVSERALGYLFIENDSFHWVLWSKGPDGYEDDGKLAYDPTNGSVSRGDLARFGP